MLIVDSRSNNFNIICKQIILSDKTMNPLKPARMYCFSMLMILIARGLIKIFGKTNGLVWTIYMFKLKQFARMS